MLLFLYLYLLLWMHCRMRKQLKSINAGGMSKTSLANTLTVLEGLKVEAASLKIPEWFLLRRIAFSAIALFALGQFWIALALLFLSSMITMTLIVGLGQPFEGIGAQRLELFNEICLLFLQYHLIAFSEFILLA